MVEIHGNIPKPFKAFVRKEFLFDLEQGHGELLEVTVIGVSSYKGEALTFTIHISNNGGLFHYIPATAIVFGPSEEFSLDDIVYENCPGSEISVFQFDYLIDQKAHVHPRKSSKLGQIQGRYLFTVDWVEDNILLHVVHLDNNCLGVFPSHKILWGEAGENQSLPKWKKLRQDWVVTH